MCASRAHVSQHTEHAQKYDQRDARLRMSGLEGRHDEWSRSSLQLSQLQAAVPPSCHRSAAAAPKLHTAYHLLFGREQLRTPLLHTTTAPIAIRGSALVPEPWTDVSVGGVERRADLGQMEPFPRFSPPPAGPNLPSPFQLPEVAPPVLASRSIPQTRPPLDYAAPAARR